MSEFAVKCTDLSKVYKLYDLPLERLKESLHPFRKKYHKEFYALKDINFQIKKGETIGIIGKNGSGKSTLLKIITGILTPTSGEVKVVGKISALLELGAGFNPEMTGIENIYLNGSISGFSKEEVSAKLPDILNFADIGDFVHQPVKMFSSGMFARLAFAVAISIEPEILIVDEALSVGDAGFQAKCYRKFNEFMKRGKTILFVTHSMDTIIKYCSTALVLDKGKKIKEGSPREMVDVYKQILSDCYYSEESDANCDTTSARGTSILTSKSSSSVSGIIDTNQNWKNSISLNRDLIEYGTKEAEIIDFVFLNSTLDSAKIILSNETIHVKIKVHFKKDVDEPIFAFAIKDLKGQELSGTNTYIEDVNIGKCKKDEIKVITFTQKTMLNSGTYTISLGCTQFSENNLTVFHRLYDVVIFEVISDKKIFGIYDIDSKVTVE